jgi:hypothetical protein
MAVNDSVEWQCRPWLNAPHERCSSSKTYPIRDIVVNRPAFQPSPGASLSLSADIHLNKRNNSYDCTYL